MLHIEEYNYKPKINKLGPKGKDLPQGISIHLKPGAEEGHESQSPPPPQPPTEKKKKTRGDAPYGSGRWALTTNNNQIFCPTIMENANGSKVNSKTTSALNNKILLKYLMCTANNHSC